MSISWLMGKNEQLMLKLTLGSLGLFFSPFFLMATTMAYGRSRARDGIWAAAVFYAAAVAMPDPLTHCARPEIKSVPPQRPEQLHLESHPTVPWWELHSKHFKCKHDDLAMVCSPEKAKEGLTLSHKGQRGPGQSPKPGSSSLVSPVTNLPTSDHYQSQFNHLFLK